MKFSCKTFLPILLSFLLVFVLPVLTEACTTVMVGRDASADGSVIMGRCNDGNRMSWIEIIPAMEFAKGTEIPMHSTRPLLGTIAQFEKQQLPGFDFVGMLPMPEQTFRTFITRGRWYGRTLSGINEHGVTIGLEFIPHKTELASDLGLVAPGGAGHWSTSMIAYALMRSETAREAVEWMGWMAEEYGYQYFLSPTAGSGHFVADKDEIWMMYTVGPGFLWEPDSGEPGAVWVAQRVPDNMVVAHANAARIGAIDLDDEDNFLASSNIFSVAKEYDLWNEDEEFLWYEVYGQPERRGNWTRVWGAYHMLAPSLQFEDVPVLSERLPLMIEPDEPVSVEDIIKVMRTQYEGTALDVTLDPAYQYRDGKSPLARPVGPSDLPNLLGISQERTIGTPSSTYVYVAQLRDWMPDSIGSLIWFAHGPSYASVFVPIYAGMLELPSAYTAIPNWKEIDRTQNAWNFQLVHNLSYIKYQEAIEDIKAVYQPAEARYFAQQTELETKALSIYDEYGIEKVNEFLTEYSYQALEQVFYAYDKLVDFLLYKYIWAFPDIAPPQVPHIYVPSVPLF